MGWDAEEGLTHYNKCRDVEEGVGGQIVEIQPVVEHESADEWVERKSQSADEVGDEYHPLMGLGGGDELPLVGQPMRDIAGEVSGAAQLGDVLLLNGGGQPFASRSGAPMRLTSWVEKSPDWGSSNEVIALQTCIQSMIAKNVKLVDVIQVMLVRQILPC